MEQQYGLPCGEKFGIWLVKASVETATPRGYWKNPTLAVHDDDGGRIGVDICFEWVF